MSGERGDEKAIVSVACGIESPELRRDYLKQVCHDRPQMRGRVEDLLRAHFQDLDFLTRPSRDVVATADFVPIAEQPGTYIGPYKLVEEMGEGGMGTVFMATQKEPINNGIKEGASKSVLVQQLTELVDTKPKRVRDAIQDALFECLARGRYCYANSSWQCPRFGTVRIGQVAEPFRNDIRSVTQDILSMLSANGSGYRAVGLVRPVEAPGANQAPDRPDTSHGAPCARRRKRLFYTSTSLFDLDNETREHQSC